MLGQPENWERLELKLDRKAFIEDLEKVRNIRNDVMHFDPDGIGESDLQVLRKFAKFLTEVNALAAS